MMISAVKRWYDELDKVYKVGAVIVTALTLLTAATRYVQGITEVKPTVDSIRVELHQHIDTAAKYSRRQADELHKIYCVTAYKAALDQRDCIADKDR